MKSRRTIVVGAGIGGLVAALLLSARGEKVLVCERAATPGGKMRVVSVGNRDMDAGPTVFTMRWVFEDIFAQAGSSLAEHLTLRPATILARHAWSMTERLDLHADLAQSADAIASFAGASEAKHFLEFSAEARRIYEILKGPFLSSARGGPLKLMARAGIADLLHINPFETLWKALGRHFKDERLRQLFGRYATYCGSSPFNAPATLILIAHVEQEGVWLIEGGIHKLASSMAALAIRHGAEFRYGTEVRSIVVKGGKVEGVNLADGEIIESDTVLYNADASALHAALNSSKANHGVLPVPPPARSLSAITWEICAKTSGFPLQRHNVFFSSSYQREFDDIFQRNALPSEPTVYICAQDRGAGADAEYAEPERLLCLINAPAIGDRHVFTPNEIMLAFDATRKRLSQCGLEIATEPDNIQATTPTEFEQMFPATGGALYGRASHGWLASFQRPGATTRIDGLFLAGGSVHPGPGVPMAALSGKLATEAILARRVSMRP
jgi:1-hydroxycarotenoid 3,4-desaturase